MNMSAEKLIKKIEEAKASCDFDRTHDNMLKGFILKSIKSWGLIFIRRNYVGIARSNDNGESWQMHAYHDSCWRYDGIKAVKLDVISEEMVNVYYDGEELKIFYS